MSEENHVEITVWLPKELVNLFEAFWTFVGIKAMTAEEYLAKEFSERGAELIGSIVFNEICDFSGAIIKNYKLEPYRKYMDVPKQA